MHEAARQYREMAERCREEAERLPLGDPMRAAWLRLEQEWRQLADRLDPDQRG